uniref:Secreted protein n=1 Tax=Heligmosomoides polygyrus TaxID=6339 RepID=A0A183GX72_HELPZ
LIWSMGLVASCCASSVTVTTTKKDDGSVHANAKDLSSGCISNVSSIGWRRLQRNSKFSVRRVGQSLTLSPVAKKGLIKFKFGRSLKKTVLSGLVLAPRLVSGCVCPSVSPSVCPSVFPSVCPSVCPSVVHLAFHKRRVRRPG